MKTVELENRVRDTIRHYGLLEPGDGVVVGVSGGPDSVALLSVLMELNKSTGWGCGLHVAHVNHMLRGGESREDERFVRGLAGSLGLECAVKEVDVSGLSSRERCSIETAARRARYEFFEELAREVSATHVAVGHTADDNAETVLHRIIRGTGLLGLGGIRPLRTISPGSKVKLVRPLLHVWRAEILSYLKEKPLNYRTDSSNLRPENNLRNRIRLELLPLLEKDYNPRMKDALTKLGDIAGRSNDFLQSRISTIVGATLKRDEAGTCSFEADLLKHHPPFFQHFFLKEVFSRMGMSLRKMDYEHYNNVIEMVEGVTECKQIELPGRWTACLEGEELCLRKTAGPSRPRTQSFEPVELVVPGITKLFDGREIRAEIIDEKIEDGFLEKFKTGKTPDEEIVDADRAGKKLYVRTRRDGDRFWPLGVGGEKKLKDFFIDTKTPRWERDNVVIVASKAHPVWVVGLRIDERVKVTPKTKEVLKLSIR
ncbi:MAG: tRNA lysidine(34) synthetase TilS [Candidatus Brocadiales bacterium]|nr:tRNA lysidine(34) synthetase TilS [Candidatus Bathyanammoxibius amoris]